MESDIKLIKINYNRNEYIDILKGIAIFFVVFGHSIQYGSGYSYYTEKLFYNNILFKFIYSFHMPLFMLISGFLFQYSIRKNNIKSLLKSRLSKIILPIVMWTLLYFIIFSLGDNWKLGILHNIKELINLLLFNLWFLWAIFYCSMAVIIGNKIFNDNIIFYLIVLIILLFISDSYNAYLYKYMYPYFILGYLWNKKNLNKFFDEIDKNKKLIIFMAISGIFFIMLTSFNYNSFVYTSRISLLEKHIASQLKIDIYRWIIGLDGSIFIILGVKLLYKKINNNIMSNILSYLGKKSLIIYIISTVFINDKILLGVTQNYSKNYIIIIIETIIVIIICCMISKVIKKVKFINKVFMGGR